MGSRDATPGQELGSRLRELREQRGLSLRDLAARAAIDYTYLSKIETAHSASRLRTTDNTFFMFDLLWLKGPARLVSCTVGRLGIRKSRYFAAPTMAAITSG